MKTKPTTVQAFNAFNQRRADAPAQVQHSPSFKLPLKIVGADIVDANGVEVVMDMLTFPDETKSYQRAIAYLDADFIVRACNNAQRLADALDKLSDRASMANATQHAGQDVPAELWSDIYQRTNEAREALAQWEQGS